MSKQNDSTVLASNRPDPETPLARARAEVDRLFKTNSIPDDLERTDVTVYIADWKRKLGNARYDRRVLDDQFGERVPSEKIASEKGHYSIGIAKRVFSRIETWTEVVAHELAHVTAYVRYGPGQDHNHNWQREAVRFGADPSSTTPIPPEMRRDPDYYVGCPNGCMKAGKKRRSKKIQYPGRYSCPRCGTNCVSWEYGRARPSEPGQRGVDCSDLR